MIEEMFTCGRFGIGDFPLLQLFVLRGIVSQLQLSGGAEKQNGGINHKGYDLTAVNSLSCFSLSYYNRPGGGSLGEDIHRNIKDHLRTLHSCTSNA